MSEGYTKGPWSETRYGYEKYAITDARGTEIGFVHRGRDARLIAAAPAMFEALTRARYTIWQDAQSARAFAADDETVEAEEILKLIDAALNQAMPITSEGEGRHG